MENNVLNIRSYLRSVAIIPESRRGKHGYTNEYHYTEDQKEITPYRITNTAARMIRDRGEELTRSQRILDQVIKITAFAKVSTVTDTHVEAYLEHLEYHDNDIIESVMQNYEITKDGMEYLLGMGSLNNIGNIIQNTILIAKICDIKIITLRYILFSESLLPF